jgi:hypothetical protein
MENLFIPAMERSPEVDFRFRENRLSLKGEAYPEDAAAFFGPLLKQLGSHCEEVRGQDLDAEIRLDYFNTSSAKALMNMMQILENTARGGSRVTLRWCFQKDDEVMREFGEDFSTELQHVHFQLIEL